jgi:hypothetical protein
VACPGVTWLTIPFAHTSRLTIRQFAYNPEWFEQEDGEDEGEGWDISQYRNAEVEEENVSAVTAEVDDLQLDSVRAEISDNP